MTQANYYRLALTVPILLAVLGWDLLSLNEALAGPDMRPVFPIAILVPATMTALGAIFYGVPYVVVATILWFRSPQWTARKLRRWLWTLPGIFTLGAALVVTAANVMTHDPDWPTYVWETARLVFLVGYGQAVLIACGELIGTRLGCLTADERAV